MSTSTSMKLKANCGGPPPPIGSPSLSRMTTPRPCRNGTSSSTPSTSLNLWISDSGKKTPSPNCRSESAEITMSMPRKASSKMVSNALLMVSV